jgi:hypothetical protein
MAGYVIHTAAGLRARDASRATELGPSEVVAADTPAHLARSAGLSVIAMEDVTVSFRDTCEAMLRARSELEDALRAEEGDEVYEEEQADKQAMLLGIVEGLLQRSLIVAAKP